MSENKMVENELLESKLVVKKEAVELATACGYIAGEVHEVTKDGIDIKDFKSVIDTAQNFEILKKGFDVKVKMNRKNLEKLSQADLIEIVMATFKGFEKGKE